MVWLINVVESEIGQEGCTGSPRSAVGMIDARGFSRTDFFHQTVHGIAHRELFWMTTPLVRFRR